LDILEQLARNLPDRAPRMSAASPLSSAFHLQESPPDRRQTKAARSVARGSARETVAKRGLDLGVALALLIVLAPLLTAIALLIRFESSGPALFRQRRLGLDGKPFRILKFRTMVVLEDGDLIRQAEPSDSRVTRVGRFLRAASLDELPQFVNVLKGEMSLVGPRPHAVVHDRLFGSLIRSYDLRRRVKPGITGWAQINGLRGATPTLAAMRRRVAHDVWYARNASLRLDLAILLRTPVEMLRRRNAF